MIHQNKVDVHPAIRRTGGHPPQTMFAGNTCERRALDYGTLSGNGYHEVTIESHDGST